MIILKTNSRTYWTEEYKKEDGWYVFTTTTKEGKTVHNRVKETEILEISEGMDSQF